MNPRPNPPASTHKEGDYLLEIENDQAAWFALYVQVNHEKHVERLMRNKSIECLLPTMERWSKRRDRRKRIQVPLFPGYVFVHTVLTSHANVQILKTPGAVRLLGNSQGPLPIPDYQILNLGRMQAHPATLASHPYLKRGDWVQVVRGPFADCIGILIREDAKKGKLVVNLDVIHQAARVEINVEDVEPAKPPDKWLY